MLGGLDVKSLREVLKIAMKTLHGDYGLGCVQHSLNSKLYDAVIMVAMVMLLSYSKVFQHDDTCSDCEVLT